LKYSAALFDFLSCLPAMCGDAVAVVVHRALGLMGAVSDFPVIFVKKI
jgi:hypothetical protein